MTSRWSLPEDDQPAASTSVAAPSALLTEPVLFVDGFIEAVPDAKVVEPLWECLKVRPRIDRSGDPSALARGRIEFESLHRAEKAYATVNGQSFPEFSSSLGLRLSEGLHDDPAPATTPLLFKSLPLKTTAGELFDLCRPFGPVHRVALQLAEGPRRGSGAAPVFKGQALVTFYEDGHSRRAMDELHCSELGSQTIILQPFVPSRARKSDISIHAPSPSSPSASRWATADSELSVSNATTQLNASVPPFTPPPARRTASSLSSMHAPSPQISPRVDSGHNSASSQSALVVDPSNLFIKNLDPLLTSADLFNLFKSFDRIVSARVMTDSESQRSKEFGFVSFEQAESAAMALQAMDGKKAGPTGRAVTVRFHEPKRYREGRLRQSEDEARSLGEMEQGMQALSAGPSPADSPITAPHSRRTSSTFDGSPSAAHSSAATSPSTSPLKFEPEQFGEVVQLLEGLPKKERALCLFNPEYLRQKIADALLVLSTSNDEEEDIRAASAPTAVPAPAPAPPSTVKSEQLVTSLAKLAALPASVILSDDLAPELSALGVTLAGEEKAREMDAFMDGLEGEPAHEVKQKLGERLFKAVKACGIKGAPRITIALLDTEELRPLAQLILLPEVLKEKVLLVAAKPAK